MRGMHFEEFKKLFPRINQVSEAEFKFQLESSEKELSETYFGDRWKECVLLLCAHKLELMDSSFNIDTDGVTDKKVGLKATPYGRELERIKQGLPTLPMWVK